MIKDTITQQVSNSDFKSQKYIPEDENIIPSFYLDTQFSIENDYIEISVFDESENKIISYNKLNSDIAITNGDVILEPSNDLDKLGLNDGLYYIKYDFFRKRLSSSPLDKYFIKEISSDRTELRLSSTQISPSDIISSVNEFILYRETEKHFVDFNLNLENNILLIANNIKIDSTLSEPSILVKLYEPLPLEYNVKDMLWVTECISEPQVYSVEFPFVPEEVIDYENIQGPNFSLNVKNQVGTSNQILNFDSIFGSNIINSQQHISNILSKNNLDVNINYENLSDFVHFSSAKSRLENFYYKIASIEEFQNQITNINDNNDGYYNLSPDLLSKNINNIIDKFDGYERFMYFNSGSLYSWPKTNFEPPYSLAPTGSVISNVWFEEMHLSASVYDENNQDYIYWTIPEYLRNDSENKNYELFLDMIGQHFDSIWVYIDKISDKFNADNRLNYGISKNLIADTLKDFGVKLYSNNFNINDLYTSLIGITPSGSMFPFSNITETLPAPSGYEYINDKVFIHDERILYTNYGNSSYGIDKYGNIIYYNEGKIVLLDDINKSIYKRIYHNLPYLLKTKGTITGLRALITLFGIPDTILKINEFGGKDRNNSGDWDYKQNIFNYGFSGSLTTGFISNPNLGEGETVPETIQFRFKHNGVPSTSYSHSLFSSFDGSTQVSSILLEYNNSGSISGSYSGSIPDLENKYGILKYIPDVNDSSKSASIYLPIFDNDWWSVQANFDHSLLTASLYVANEINGEIGFKASSSINDSFTSYFTYNPVTSSLNKFDGYFQELRYYNTVINKNSFYDYVLNPLSCEGNSIDSTNDKLFFRAPLGSNLDIDSRISIHPRITGSWVSTSSFSDGTSGFVLSGSFISNTENIYYDQPAIGIRNPITDKINIENHILPEGDVLSAFRYIQQQSFISSSYNPDVNYLEVAFSPQDQINEDIMSQIGYFNIGEYIGDPRQINNDGNSYPDLNRLRDEYFKKYLHNYNLNDFIRLIKYFDNSLFKMLKDFTPAKTDLATGIIIKQHILERNKQKPVQISYNSELYTSSIKSLPNNYEEGALMYTTEGGGGGSFSHLNAISQSWSQSIQFPYKLTSSADNAIKIADNREFYNGELPGSFVYTEMTEHCQQYKNSGYTDDFSHDFDCQPAFNNVSRLRENPQLQDVDYSVGISSPVNIEQLQTNTATRGTVPASNYTLKKHKIPRYDGSKSSSDGVNLSSGLTGSYDNYPPVESKKTHFAYISEVKDPYPVVNNTTNLYVKYIIDTETNIDDPSLSNVTFYNMKNLFVSNETINSSLKIPKTEPQFINLNGSQNISHIGEEAVPILYSQNASNGYVNEIPLKFDNENEEIPLNYGFTSSNDVRIIIPSNSNGFNVSPVNLSRNIEYYDLKLNTGNDPIQSDGSIYCPEFDSSYSLFYDIELPSTLVNSQGAILSLFFYIESSSDGIIYTTLPTVDYSNIEFKFYQNDVLVFAESAPHSIINYSVTDGVLEFIFNENDNFQNYLNDYINNPVYINLIPNYFSISLKSSTTSNLSNSEHYRIVTKTTLENNDNANPIPTNYDFIVSDVDPVDTKKIYIDASDRAKLEFLRVGDELLKVNGDAVLDYLTIANVSIFNSTITFSDSLGGMIHVNDVITIKALNGLLSSESPMIFNPIGFTPRNTTPSLSVSSSNVYLPKLNFKTSGSNFWSFYSGSLNKIKLDSVGGNLSYLSGSEFYQSFIPYNLSSNSRFVGGSEPEGTQFPQIKDPWKLYPGDEIRFENNENKSYVITNVDNSQLSGSNFTVSGNEYVRVSGNQGTGSLILELDKNISSETNLNFFLIRRYKESRNNITINKTFPYSNIVLSSSLAPTTTGFIFPKYPVDKIANNPDKIIRDLIDKKIVE